MIANCLTHFHYFFLITKIAIYSGARNGELDCAVAHWKVMGNSTMANASYVCHSGRTPLYCKVINGQFMRGMSLKRALSTWKKNVGLEKRIDYFERRP